MIVTRTHGFRTAAVVGAGLMGSRIAAVLAAGGLDTRLHDADPAVLAAVPASPRLTPVTGLRDAVRDTDIVIEAVTEDLAVKQDLLAEIGAAAPAAVLATNTSVLPVTAIAARVPGRARVLGTHWWNPPDLIPVVEVVPGRDTSALCAERTMALLTALGKTPVLVRTDTPGFIGNRLQHALWREAIALIAEGVCDAATVDLVARNTIGLRLARMGPIENADYVGLDLTLAIHRAVFPALCADAEPAGVLREHVRRNELGAKTGRGFLDWPPGAREKAARELADHVNAQLNGGRR